MCWQSLFTNSTKILTCGKRKGLTMPATGISGHYGTENAISRLLCFREGAPPRQQPQVWAADAGQSCPREGVGGRAGSRSLHALL